MNNRKKSATLTLLCTLVRVQTGLQSHRTTHSIRTTMARTRNALKRQKVASSSIQSALFSLVRLASNGESQMSARCLRSSDEAGEAWKTAALSRDHF